MSCQDFRSTLHDAAAGQFRRPLLERSPDKSQEPEAHACFILSRAPRRSAHCEQLPPKRVQRADVAFNQGSVRRPAGGPL